MAEASSRAARLRALLLLLLLLLGSAFAVSPPGARADEHDHTLTVDVAGQGSVSGPGMACPGTCSGVYRDRERLVCPKPDQCHIIFTPPRITLQAFADAGWLFAGWSDPCAGAGACSITLTKPEHSVGASFANIAPAVSVSTSGALTGTANLTASASDADGVQQLRFLVDDTDVGAANASFALAWDTSAVADGPHAIKARATDNAGTSAVSDAAAVVVDNTRPALAFTDGPDGAAFAPGSTQTWTFAASDATSGPASLACRLDGGAWSPCTGAGSMTVTGAAGGSHTLDVQATDGAGLTAQASRSFVIDANPPRTTITSGVADGTRTSATELTFGFSADEPGARFECRVFPAALTPPAFGACSAAGAHTAARFDRGSYAFEVRAIDPFGNVEPEPQRRAFTVLAGADEASGEQAVGTRGRLGAEPGGVAFGVSYRYKLQGDRTWFTQLAVKGLTSGARLKVRCRGAGCPRRLARTRAHGRIAITGLLRRRLHPSAVVGFVATKPGLRGRELRLRIRDGRPPVFRRSCLDLSGKRATCRAAR